MRISGLISRVLVGILVLTVCWCEADIFEMEPVADARILGVYPDTNFESDLISIYTAEGNVQRTLLLFELSSLNIPAGHQVSSAILSLTASTAYGGSQRKAMEVYRTLSAWTENGVSWKLRMVGQPWAQPGGDYVGRNGMQDLDPYATSYEDPANLGTVSWEIAELAQEWIDGLYPNYGLLVRSYLGNGLHFPSTESNSDTRVHPRLTLITAASLPRLRAGFVAPEQVAISWRGENVGSLEESSSTTGAAWTPTIGAPTVAGGRTEVRVSIGGTRKFFRLRSP